MSGLLNDIAQFANGLLDHLVAFATGSVPVMILGFWERWKNRTIHFRLYLALFLAFGLVAASFQQWREEHAARITAEQAPHGRNPEVVKHLQEYYADSVSFYDALMSVKTDKENEELEKQIDDWSKEVGPWVLTNMGAGAYARLIDTSGQSTLTLQNNNLKPGQADSLRAMAGLRANLKVLVESLAWDKP